MPELGIRQYIGDNEISTGGDFTFYFSNTSAENAYLLRITCKIN